MPQADHLTDAQIRQIVAMIAEQKQAFAEGVEGLYTLKKVLEHAVHRIGIIVEWDPSTPPAVRDRFAIVSLSALQWSFGGAALSLMIGVFTERPALWAAGGAAIVGGVQGHEAVECGWRLRGYHNEQGVECVEVIVRARRAISVGWLAVIVEPSTGRDSAG